MVIRSTISWNKCINFLILEGVALLTLKKKNYNCTIGCYGGNTKVMTSQLHCQLLRKVLIQAKTMATLNRVCGSSH
jgi:ribonuclease HIII